MLVKHRNCHSVFSYFLDTEDGLEPVNMTLSLSGAVLIATLVTGFGLGLIEVYKWLPVETSIKTTAFTGVFALILGGACFNFRKKYRAYWGATEVATGFLIVIHRTMNTPTALNQPDIEYMIAVLTAGIYLMVRGFENIDQGLSTKHSQKSDNVKSPTRTA